MLLDNKTHGKVADELRRSIEPESKLAILTGFFTVYGFAALKGELSKIDNLRLLLADREATLPIRLAGNADEIGLKNELNLQHIATECAQWVRKKAEVRSLSGAPIRQNLFHVSQPDGDAVAISGTSDLTAPGLGTVQSSAFAMNTVATDRAAAQQLIDWFDTIWNDPTAIIQAKETLLQALENLAADKPANLLYFLTLFTIFRDFLDDID